MTRIVHGREPTFEAVLRGVYSNLQVDRSVALRACEYLYLSSRDPRTVLNRPGLKQTREARHTTLFAGRLRQSDQGGYVGGSTRLTRCVEIGHFFSLLRSVTVPSPPDMLSVHRLACLVAPLLSRRDRATIMPARVASPTSDGTHGI
jgi:hypothetical protein